MSSFSTKAKPTLQHPKSSRPNRSGRVLVIILGVVVIIVLLSALFVYVGLPALSCPKAETGSPTGSVSDFCFTPFTGGSHSMGGLVAGPDGNLWFTEIGHIGRLTPAGAVTEFALASSDSKPGVIVAGPDGNLWFTEPSAKALGVLPQQVS